MPFQKGHPKIAGRTKDSPKKVTVEARLKDLKCDPIALLANIANNNLECGVCRGEGVTKYQPKIGRPQTPKTPEEMADWAEGTVKEPEGKERICQSCWGSKLERIDPKTRLDAGSRLLAKIAPDLKAIEVVGNDDKPPVGIRVISIKADGNPLD